MRNTDKTKEQLIEELEALRLRTAELEKLEAERKQMENVLGQPIEQFQTLLEEAPIGICNTDLKGKITYVNKRFEEVSGYSRQEVVGKNGFKLGMFSAETLKLLGKRMKDRLRGRPSRVLEIQFKCKDGHWIWVAIEGKLIRERGIPLGFQVISRNITERRQAEEELRESEEKYRHLFENLNDAIFLADAETGRILETNWQGVVLLGRSRNEIVGMHQSALHPPDKTEEYRQKFATHVEKGHAADYEGEVIRKNGTIIPVVISASPITIHGRSLILGAFRDITERKRAEEELRQSEEELRKMFESVTDGISVIDLNGVITEVNREAVRMHGFNSKDELLGKSAFELVAPRHHERITTNMRKALKQGTIKGVEYTLLKADGSEFPGELSTSALKDASGNWVGHITISRDITERKRAKEALERQKAYFQQLFDDSPEGIALLDDADRIIQVNRGFETLFGYQTEEIKGRFINDIIIPGYRIEEASALSQAVLNNKVVRDKTVRKRKDGSLVDVSVLGYPIQFGNKTLGVYAIYSDITERKRVEEERREMEQKAHLASRLASVGEMASGIAHEINNPLTAVIGFAQLLMDANIPDDVREDIGVIHKEAQRAAGVAKNLLTFARKQALAKQLTNINSIIGGVLELRAYEQRVNNIQVNTRFAPKLPEVMADYSQLQQVFINIIINAEAAMLEAHNGGTLTVTTQKVNDTIRASFTDSGPGIAKENLNLIFDPFFTTKEVGKGTGLGLSVCHGIVVEHGGRIYARSKLGKGATFVVELPINAIERWEDAK